jgi:hypothetical protein
MDLNDVRNFVNVILKEHSPTKVFMPPVQFVDVINQCSLIQFKKKIGLPEEYRPGQPVPRQAYEITKRLTLDLMPFKVEMGTTTTPLVVDAYGIATLPDNCYYPSAFGFRLYRNGSLDYREVDVVNDMEWGARLRNSITRPTQKYPVCNFLGNHKVRFSPINLKKVDFVYLKYPTPAVFGFTIVDGFIKYNVNTSTQLEWDDVNMIDIIMMFLERMGVIMNRADLIQHAQKVEGTGQ